MNQSVSRQKIAQVITAKLLAEPTRQKHWLRVLAAYLAEHKLVDDAELLVNDIAHELFVQTGRLTVEVTSAASLSAAVRANLTKYLREATGAQHVALHESVDDSVLGGLIARTPDAELDTTVKRTLRQLAAIA